MIIEQDLRNKLSQLLLDADTLLAQLDKKKDKGLIQGKFTKVDMWKRKVSDILEEIADQRLIQKFNEAGFFSFDQEADENKSFEYVKKIVQKRKAIIIELLSMST